MYDATGGLARIGSPQRNSENNTSKPAEPDRESKNDMSYPLDPMSPMGPLGPIGSLGVIVPYSRSCMTRPLLTMATGRPSGVRNSSLGSMPIRRHRVAD